MSSIWKKTSQTPRSLERQWMNTIFNSHDLFCECNDPELHFLIILNKNSSAIKPEPEIRNIKCLLTGDGDAGKETTENFDDPGFLEGELEKLFNENDGENPTTSGTR